MSRRFILQARAELEHGNRLQAGEKAWAAAAQHLKIVGERRGWYHGSHRQLENIGRQIVTEYNEPELGHALSAAYKGHENFYSTRAIPENYRSAREIVEAVEAVEDALPLLESLDFQPPRPFVIRSNQQLRRLAQLTGNRELQLGDTSSVGFSLRQSEPPSGGGQ